MINNFTAPALAAASAIVLKNILRVEFFGPETISTQILRQIDSFSGNL